VPNYTDLVNERIEQEAEFLPQPVQQQSVEEITPEFIADCLENNELGDGRLFAALHRGKFVNVKRWDKKPWMKFTGQHWSKDEMGEVLTSVNKVAITYVNYAETFNLPIKRTKELLAACNTRVTAATNRMNALKKQADIDASALNSVQQEIKDAESDTLLHQTELDLLQAQRKSALDRARQLRSLKRAQSCLAWAHHTEKPLAITGREIDQSPMLLACPNCVIDLEMGEWRDGKPEDYLLKTTAVEFPLWLGKQAIDHYLIHGELPDGTSPCPTWHAFKQSIQPDPEILACMDRIMGYAITGHSRREQFIAVYLGKGRNGKGTYFDTWQDIMGDLAWTVKPELFLEDKNSRSAGAANPEIVMMEGRRIVIASETDENQHVSCAKIKSLTGGDKQNARGLFDGDEKNIQPTWTLFLQTNVIPAGLTKDLPTRKRLILIDFPFIFDPNPEESAIKEPHLAARYKQADKDLFDNLQKEKPYILLDMVRCCLLYQQAKGINPPDKMKANVEEQRIKEDTLQQFIYQRCMMEYEPLRSYEEGQVCSVADPNGKCGSKYRSLTSDNKGNHPATSDQWTYEGPGLLPNHPVIFKEFYSIFSKWYSDERSDSEKYKPSTISVGKQLREKGLDVRAKGAGTRIWGGIEVSPELA